MKKTEHKFRLVTPMGYGILEQCDLCKKVLVTPRDAFTGEMVANDKYCEVASQNKEGFTT